MTKSVGIISKLKKPAEILKILFAWAVLAVVVWRCKPSPQNYWLGSTAFFLGETIRVWAAGHLRRSAILATDGPYAYVRDPLYLGRLLWVIGIGFYSQQPMAAGALVVIFLWYYETKKVPKEMQRLEGIFGEPYRDYCASVHSLLPRLRAYPGRSGTRWQWDTFLHNKEHLGLIIIIGVVVIFGFKALPALTLK